mgnify:CR=1 FL=1|tara:strand:+ start:6468 stop:7937 length:1470 start_codon:yes stop_codon:yes gene_type:complete
MKNKELVYAKDLILEPAGLNVNHIETILGKALIPGVDFADLYFEQVYAESLSLEDGKVKDAGYSVDKGVGLRVISGEKTGYAYSDDIALKSLENSVLAAKNIVNHGQNKQIKLESLAKEKNNLISHDLYTSLNPLESISIEDKKALLESVDKEARKFDTKIKKVEVSLSGSYKVVLIANSLGLLIPDIRPLVRLNVSVIAEDNNGRKESGSSGGGGRFGYMEFTKDNWHLDQAKEAARIALLNLESKSAPAGMMPVALGSGWPGVLLHEAVGHGLEGDFNRKKSSAFHDKLGEQVASSLCTVVDNGTLESKRGSLNIDDEGVPTQNTVLIEKGILKGYMQDRLNAKLMNTVSTGNGRRESFAHIPMPRMTNTYMLPGNHNKEEIISSIKKGLYAVSFNGGQVDITSGQFVFVASEAYFVEDGKIKYPVKGATLIGNGPEVLKKVSMVGNDLRLDPGIGTCGKDGQSVPVCVGQPTIKIDELTVGGTQSE